MCPRMFVDCTCVKFKIPPNTGQSSQVGFDQNFGFDFTALDKGGLNQLTALNLKLQ